MKNLLYFFALFLPLAACYHDDVKPVTPEVPYPNLPAQSDFDALHLQGVADLNLEKSEQAISDILVRLMNVIEIANQEADEVAEEESRPDPIYRSLARELVIVESAVSSNRCQNEDDETTNTESLIWDDADNSQTETLGDEWFYIWEGCEASSNGAVLTGVMSFSGMTVNPLSGESENDDSDVFTDHQYNFDLQIDSLINKSVFLQNVKFVYSRELDDNEEEITTLEILPGAVMGVIAEEGLYSFQVNSITLVSSEGDSNLSVNINARYFDSSDDLDGYVDIVTNENLLFEYDLELKNPQSKSKLLSGDLEISVSESSKANLTVDSDDETKIQIVYADQTAEPENQTSFFDNATFSLVNLTGLSN